MQVYDYKLDACGTNHITIGDAGNTEVGLLCPLESLLASLEYLNCSDVS